MSHEQPQHICETSDSPPPVTPKTRLAKNPTRKKPDSQKTRLAKKRLAKNHTRKKVKKEKKSHKKKTIQTKKQKKT